MADKNFDEELKEMSMYVYLNGSGKISKRWKKVPMKIDESDGFYAEVYDDGKNVVIAFRGTDVERGYKEGTKDVLLNDIPMVAGFKPAQVENAEKLYKDVQSKYPSKRVVFTGHSLGGSIAQVMSAKTGRKAVTYNAYGTGYILEEMGIPYENQRFLDIKNYGNPKDGIFRQNDKYQPGVTLYTNKNLDPDVVNSRTKDLLANNMPHKKYHELENMDSLSKAVRAEEVLSSKPLRIEGRVSYGRELDHSDTGENTLADLKNPKEDKINTVHRKIQEYEEKLKKKKLEKKNTQKQSKSKNSAKGSGDGRWITMNGAHIHLD